MPLIEIKHWNGIVLHTIEADNMKAAVEALVERGACLRGADLRGADLRDACLGGACLGDAWLRDADLMGADLRGACLGDAWLRDADLRDARLGDADLRDADLKGACLMGADLRDACLRGADLRGAKIDDLMCLSELSDAIDLAPMIWHEWEQNGFEAAKNRFSLYQVRNEVKALIAMCPSLIGGFCFILHRREIWWWNWSCPNPKSVPVLWRE